MSDNEEVRHEDRRTFIKEGVIAGTGIGLAGCLGGGPQSQSSQGGKNGSGQQGTGLQGSGTLEILWFPGQLSQKNQDALKQFFSDWENGSGWTIQTSTASQASGLVQQARSRFEAGDGFDLIMCPGLGLMDFANRGYLAPLNDQFQDAPFSPDDFSSAKLLNTFVHGEGFFDGKIWGVPLMAGHWGSLFYNASVFKEAGYDPMNPQKYLTTRKDMLNVGRTIKQETGIHPFGFSGADHIHTAVQFYALYFSSLSKKGQTLINNGSLSLSEGPGLEVAQFYDTLQKENLFPQGVSANNAIDMRNLFTSDQTAMYHIGSWEASILRENTDMEWGVTYLPKPSNGTHAGFTGGWAWVVGQNAPMKPTWDLVKYLTTPERQNKIAGLPPALQKGLEMRFKGFKDGLGRDVGDVFIDEINNSGFPAIDPSYSSVNETIISQVQKVILGDSSPKSAMETAEKRISNTLDLSGDSQAANNTGNSSTN